MNALHQHIHQCLIHTYTVSEKKYDLGLKRAQILLYRIMLYSNNTVHTFVGLSVFCIICVLV